MASKKPRNKKYSAMRNAERMAKTALRHTAAAYVTGDDFCELIDTRSGKKLPVSRLMAGCVENFTYQWSILIAVFGRDAEGRDYIKSEVIQTQTAYYQRDLVEVLNNQHKRLIDGFNSQQMLGAGWIASPNGEDWSEEHGFNLFHTLGAFNRTRDPVTGEIFVTDPKETTAA